MICRSPSHSAIIQEAPTAVRLYAFAPQDPWSWGAAKMRGDNARALKTNSISPRSLAASTSCTPETMAKPASTKAIPVNTAQKGGPRGFHLVIMGVTVQTAVRCERPKSTAQSPKAQRAANAALCESESRSDSDFQTTTAATKRMISWQTSPRTPKYM